MNKSIQIGDVKAEPGNTSYGLLKVAETVDGAPINVPITIVNGAKPGYTLWLQAGIHGDEYEGPEVVSRLAKKLKPEDLAGAVIAAPVVNISAFRGEARINPIDRLNLNRIFPGKPNGTNSEQVAHVIFEEVLKNAQFLIDLHSGGLELLMASLVIYHKAGGETEIKSERLGKAFGLPIVWQSSGEWLEGSLHTEIAKKGIPAIAVETGGEGRLREEYVAASYNGVMNALKHLNMIPGEPDESKNQTFISNASWIRTKRGGLLHLEVDLGKKVSKGDRVAVVKNLFGEEVEVIISPIDGVVVGIKTMPAVNTGDWTYLIGKIIRCK